MSALEREVKLAAPAGFRLPPLTDSEGGVFEGPAQTLELDATYFDTADLRLARAGALLRFRSDDGWTVKLPTLNGNHEDDHDLLRRDEHHFSGDTAEEPPGPALDLVRALIRKGSVSTVAKLHTTRRRLPIHSIDGVPIAEVLDDRVDVVSGATLERTFREIEVELTDAATELHRNALLARLRSASAGAADPTPKIVRALGPRATAPADVEVPELDEESPIADIVRGAIASCVAKLVAHDPGVRLGTDDEDVHQARVATRRLRSHLQTFGPLLDEQWATALRDELRWLGDVLGAVRDADVLRARLDRNLDRLPAVDRGPAEQLLDGLRNDLDRRRVQLLDAYRGDRYVSLLDRLVLAARHPRLLFRVDSVSDHDLLRSLVQRHWTKLANAVDDLPRDPTDGDLHAVRIRVKRVRYAAEAVQPAFGKPARIFARAMTDLQDVLGEHQDAVIAAEWLRTNAARTARESVGFSAGQLAALEHLDAMTARDQWRAAWKQASRKRLRSWL